jgi:hypothetical protein
MRNFKRTCAAVLLFAAVLAVVSGAICAPYLRGEVYFYQDAAVRRQLAGTLDTVYLGSSFGYRAFEPVIIDGVLGTSSYNLGGAMMTMQGRYELFKKELSRNPIKTAVIELGVTAFSRDRAEEGPEGDIYVLGRLDTFFERAGWFLNSIRVSEWPRLWYDTLNRGVYAWQQKLHGRSNAVIQYETRGFVPVGTNAQTLTPEELESVRDTESWGGAIADENIYYLEKILELCRERGIKVIFTTATVTDRAIFMYSDLDEMHEYYEKLAERENAVYIDMNLLKERKTLFADETAYFDKLHLSKSGADVFSKTWAELVLAVKNGEHISPLFYDGYAELKAELENAEQ